MRSRLARLGLAAAACLATAEPGSAADPENTLLIDLSTGGRVVIEMLPEIAPKHVARIKELARDGFYDGIVFHRVIDGFMAQTGDPTGTGTGGSGRGKLPAEFSKVPFERGVVGMARTRDPNSADSQFFIMFAPAPHLNGQYTVWGRVIEGMEFVDRIARTEPRPPAQLDRMVKVRLASDQR
jgi:peptidylprolyl isomerase